MHDVIYEWFFVIKNVTCHIFSVVAAECDVKELWGLSQLAKTGADVRLEVVPPETNNSWTE